MFSTNFSKICCNFAANRLENLWEGGGGVPMITPLGLIYYCKQLGRPRVKR